MEIKVLGPGCAKCGEAEKIMKAAVEEAGVAATIEKVSDFQQIAKFGVFSTPAVVIDGQIKCVGKVPSKAEALGWLAG
ncbi:MAG: thioredoxin family protein [Desulfurivibrionaceae bacterium]|jgi:small redox-active disulfide protein 2|nr:TM0996/MTH895 family glutaredoxin-like protein [Pseudomonadota bacterium]MCG2823855.1 thioredoxin family protein [Desulfobulbaceae bacterium]MDP2003349.1 thioredoxin family protein [Desulfurivibrionaceae bacterium]PKN23606.1 MAG: thioredoxin family protein [Deltaproteobacteria bacterium HGW-Deltaproteobacteria-3]MBU4407641.1 TM0996/MTH895 family glutaredoxin-like protein [Pseudomonadota bacterium]